MTMFWIKFQFYNFIFNFVRPETEWSQVLYKARVNSSALNLLTLNYPSCFHVQKKNFKSPVTKRKLNKAIFPRYKN